MNSISKLVHIYGRLRRAGQSTARGPWRALQSGGDAKERWNCTLAALTLRPDERCSCEFFIWKRTNRNLVFVLNF